MKSNCEIEYQASWTLHLFRYHGKTQTETVSIDYEFHSAYIVPLIYKGLHDCTMNILFGYQQAFDPRDPQSDEHMKSCIKELHDNAVDLATHYARFIMRLMALRLTPDTETDGLFNMAQRLERVNGMADLFPILVEVQEAFSIEPTKFITREHERTIGWELYPRDREILCVKGELLNEPGDFSGRYTATVDQTLTNWDEICLPGLISRLIPIATNTL